MFVNQTIIYLITKNESFIYLKVLPISKMKINIIKLKCKRCEHVWVPTQEEIRICPKCKSPYWDRERRRER